MTQTLNTAHFATSEVRRSRFHAFAVPYAELESTLQFCRRTHSKANHYCTAARWLDEQQAVRETAKDDGEPGGTAGRPMLRILQSGDWINVGLVVVRYFGGIKLGTGGLARAYSGAASAALAAASAIPYEAEDAVTINVTFSAMDAVERFIRDAELDVEARNFHADGVKLTVRGSAAPVSRLRELAQQKAYD